MQDRLPGFVDLQNAWIRGLRQRISCVPARARKIDHLRRRQCKSYRSRAAARLRLTSAKRPCILLDTPLFCLTEYWAKVVARPGSDQGSCLTWRPNARQVLRAELVTSLDIRIDAAVLTRELENAPKTFTAQSCSAAKSR